jgi:MFS family permease
MTSNKVFLTVAVAYFVQTALSFISQSWDYYLFGWIQYRQNINYYYTLLGVDAWGWLYFAGGMAIFGSFSHKFSSVNFVIFGLLASACSYIVWMIPYISGSFFNTSVFSILVHFSHLCRATVWPGMLAIFAQNLSAQKKGLSMFLWALTVSLGSITARSLLPLIMSVSSSSSRAYLVVLLFVILGVSGVACSLLFFGFKENPNFNPFRPQQFLQEQLDERDPSLNNSDNEIELSVNAERKFKFSIFSYLQIPSLLRYILSYVFLQAFCSHFLLPILSRKYFLDVNYPWKWCFNYLSMYDCGVIISTLVVGKLIDRKNNRHTYAMIALISAIAPIIVIFIVKTRQEWYYYFFSFLCGLCLGAPTYILNYLTVV